MSDGVFKQRYFVSNYGKLFAGGNNPDSNLWNEVSFDTFQLLLDVAKVAWDGYYDIYDFTNNNKTVI